MRKLLIVFATFALLFTSGLGGLLARQGFQDARRRESFAAQLRVDQAAGARVLTVAPDPTGPRLGGFAAALVAGLGLLLYALVFVKKGVPLVGALLIAASVASVLANPEVPPGVDLPSPRVIAIVVSMFAVMQTVCCLGADRLRQHLSVFPHPHLPHLPHLPHPHLPHAPPPKGR